MITEAWFAAQLSLAFAALPVGRWLASRPPAAWKSAAAFCVLAMFLWPLMRFFPVTPIRLLGAGVVSCIEFTGIFIPATLLFCIASRHASKPSDARALWLLMGVCLIYAVRTGWWMISAGVPDLGSTKLHDGVCRQTTDYTCVAASMVTMLQSVGVEATETEMARLSYTDVGGGATDSRAVWALERKLAGTRFQVRYAVMDVAELIAVPKPCMAQLDWGFFISHMVPIMSADASSVVIGDPLTGLRSEPMAEFLRHWKRRVIYLTPAP